MRAVKLLLGLAGLLLGCRPEFACRTDLDCDAEPNGVCNAVSAETNQTTASRCSNEAAECRCEHPLWVATTLPGDLGPPTLRAVQVSDTEVAVAGDQSLFGTRSTTTEGRDAWNFKNVALNAPWRKDPLEKYKLTSLVWAGGAYHFVGPPNIRLVLEKMPNLVKLPATLSDCTKALAIKGILHMACSSSSPNPSPQREIDGNGNVVVYVPGAVFAANDFVAVVATAQTLKTFESEIGLGNENYSPGNISFKDAWISPDGMAYLCGSSGVLRSISLSSPKSLMQHQVQIAKDDNACPTSPIEPTAPNTWNFFGLFGSGLCDGCELFMVGERSSREGIILHYKDGRWRQEAPCGLPPLRAIHGRAGLLFAVGGPDDDKGPGVVLRRRPDR